MFSGERVSNAYLTYRLEGDTLGETLINTAYVTSVMKGTSVSLIDRGKLY